MSDWRTKELGTLCTIQMGKTPARGNRKLWDTEKSSNNVWLSIADLEHGNEISDSKEYISDTAAVSMKIVPKGTVMVSFKLSLGRTSFAARDLYTNEAIASLINLNTEIDKNYLYYYFTHFNWDKASESDIKVKGKTLNKAKLAKLPIRYPSLTQQKTIVSKLDNAFETIDQAIANTETIIENITELRKSILSSLLTEPNKPEYPLSEVCALINGRAYSKEELLDEGKYRVLRVGNLFTSKHWYYSDLELDDKKYIESGDLIYAWSASFGARIWEEEKVIYHYHIWKVIPNTELVTKDFLYLLFEWDKERITSSHGAGTTMIHVSKKSMENRVLPIPNLKDQNRIVHDFKQKNTKLNELEMNYRFKLGQLSELKKSILNIAFKGQLISNKS